MDFEKEPTELERDATLRRMGGMAVIGLGYQGRETHCRYLSKLGLLTAVADLRRKAADVAARQFKVQAFSGPSAVEDLLAAGPYAGVTVAVGSQYHAGVTRAVLRHTNALVEKPIVLHPAEAEELFDLAAEHDRVLDAHHPLNAILPEGPAIARSAMRFGRMEVEWRRQEGRPQTVVASDPIWDLGSHQMYVHRAWLPTARVPDELQARYGSYATTGEPDRFRADIHYPALTEPAPPFELEGGLAQFTGPREHPPLDVTLLAVYISPAMHAAGRFERLTFSAEGKSSGAYVRFATARGRTRGAISFSIAGHSVRLPLEESRLSVAEAQGPAIEHFLDLLVGEGTPYINRAEAVLQAKLLTTMAESASDGGRLIRL